MVQELTHTRTGDTLRYKRADLPSGLYRIDLHADASQPAVDPALYARTQELVTEVGPVQSMYRLSGCVNNADFEKKAIESGVRPGLIEMVRLAGEGQ